MFAKGVSMETNEAIQAVEGILKEELDTNSPETLYKQLAVVESLAYLACKKQAQHEMKLALAEERLAVAKAETIPSLTGTAIEKTTKMEADTAKEATEVAHEKARMAYWKQVGRIIENKISLGQSVLANITSQVKAGMYFNNVK